MDVVVDCCEISYHYNCTIFDDRGVKMAQLGVYIAIPTVDGEMIWGVIDYLIDGAYPMSCRSRRIPLVE